MSSVFRKYNVGNRPSDYMSTKTKPKRRQTHPDSSPTRTPPERENLTPTVYPHEYGKVTRERKSIIAHAETFRRQANSPSSTSSPRTIWELNVRRDSPINSSLSPQSHSTSPSPVSSQRKRKSRRETAKSGRLSVGVDDDDGGARGRSSSKDGRLSCDHPNVHTTTMSRSSHVSSAQATAAQSTTAAAVNAAAAIAASIVSSSSSPLEHLIDEDSSSGATTRSSSRASTASRSTSTSTVKSATKSKRSKKATKKSSTSRRRSTATSQSPATSSSAAARGKASRIGAGASSSSSSSLICSTNNLSQGATTRQPLKKTIYERRTTSCSQDGWINHDVRQTRTSKSLHRRVFNKDGTPVMDEIDDYNSAPECGYANDPKLRRRCAVFLEKTEQVRRYERQQAERGNQSLPQQSAETLHQQRSGLIGNFEDDRHLHYHHHHSHAQSRAMVTTTAMAAAVVPINTETGNTTTNILHSSEPIVFMTANNERYVGNVREYQQQQHQQHATVTHLQYLQLQQQQQATVTHIQYQQLQQQQQHGTVEHFQYHEIQHQHQQHYGQHRIVTHLHYSQIQPQHDQQQHFQSFQPFQPYHRQQQHIRVLSYDPRDEEQQEDYNDNDESLDAQQQQQEQYQDEHSEEHPERYEHEDVKIYEDISEVETSSLQDEDIVEMSGGRRNSEEAGASGVSGCGGGLLKIVTPPLVNNCELSPLNRTNLMGLSFSNVKEHIVSNSNNNNNKNVNEDISSTSMGTYAPTTTDRVNEKEPIKAIEQFPSPALMAVTQPPLPPPLPPPETPPPPPPPPPSTPPPSSPVAATTMIDHDSSSVVKAPNEVVLQAAEMDLFAGLADLLPNVSIDDSVVDVNTVQQCSLQTTNRDQHLHRDSNLNESQNDSDRIRDDEAEAAQKTLEGLLDEQINAVVEQQNNIKLSDSGNDRNNRNISEEDDDDMVSVVETIPILDDLIPLTMPNCSDENPDDTIDKILNEAVKNTCLDDDSNDQMIMTDNQSTTMTNNNNSNSDNNHDQQNSSSLQIQSLIDDTTKHSAMLLQQQQQQQQPMQQPVDSLNTSMNAMNSLPTDNQSTESLLLNDSIISVITTVIANTTLSDSIFAATPFKLNETTTDTAAADDIQTGSVPRICDQSIDASLAERTEMINTAIPTTTINSDAITTGTSTTDSLNFGFDITSSMYPSAEPSSDAVDQQCLPVESEEKEAGVVDGESAIAASDQTQPSIIATDNDLMMLPSPPTTMANLNIADNNKNLVGTKIQENSDNNENNLKNGNDEDAVNDGSPIIISDDNADENDELWNTVEEQQNREDNSVADMISPSIFFTPRIPPSPPLFSPSPHIPLTTKSLKIRVKRTNLQRQKPQWQIETINEIMSGASGTNTESTDEADTSIHNVSINTQVAASTDVDDSEMNSDVNDISMDNTESSDSGRRRGGSTSSSNGGGIGAITSGTGSSNDQYESSSANPQRSSDENNRNDPNTAQERNNDIIATASNRNTLSDIFNDIFKSSSKSANEERNVAVSQQQQQQQQQQREDRKKRSGNTSSSSSSKKSESTEESFENQYNVKSLRQRKTENIKQGRESSHGVTTKSGKMHKSKRSSNSHTIRAADTLMLFSKIQKELELDIIPTTTHGSSDGCPPHFQANMDVRDSLESTATITATSMTATNTIGGGGGNRRSALYIPLSPLGQPPPPSSTEEEIESPSTINPMVDTNSVLGQQQQQLQQHSQQHGVEVSSDFISVDSAAISGAVSSATDNSKTADLMTEYDADDDDDDDDNRSKPNTTDNNNSHQDNTNANHPQNDNMEHPENMKSMEQLTLKDDQQSNDNCNPSPLTTTTTSRSRRSKKSKKLKASGSSSKSKCSSSKSANSINQDCNGYVPSGTGGGADEVEDADVDVTHAFPQELLPIPAANEHILDEIVNGGASITTAASMRDDYMCFEATATVPMNIFNDESRDVQMSLLTNASQSQHESNVMAVGGHPSMGAHIESEENNFGLDMGGQTTGLTAFPTQEELLDIENQKTIIENITVVDNVKEAEERQQQKKQKRQSSYKQTSSEIVEPMSRIIKRRTKRPARNKMKGSDDSKEVPPSSMSSLTVEDNHLSNDHHQSQLLLSPIVISEGNSSNNDKEKDRIPSGAGETQTNITIVGSHNESLSSPHQTIKEDPPTQERKRKYSTKDSRHHNREDLRHPYSVDGEKYSKKKSKTDDDSALDSSATSHSTEPLLNNSNTSTLGDGNTENHHNTNSNNSDIIIAGNDKSKTGSNKGRKGNDRKNDIADSALMIPIVKIKRNLSPSTGTTLWTHDIVKKPKLSEKGGGGKVPKASIAASATITTNTNENVATAMDEAATDIFMKRQCHTIAEEMPKDSFGEVTSNAPVTPTTTLTMEEQSGGKEAVERSKYQSTSKKRDDLSVGHKTDHGLSLSSDSSFGGSSSSYAKSHHHDHSSSAPQIPERTSSVSPPHEKFDGFLKCLQRNDKVVLVKKSPCYDDAKQKSDDVRSPSFYSLPSSRQTSKKSKSEKSPTLKSASTAITTTTASNDNYNTASVTTISTADAVTAPIPTPTSSTSTSTRYSSYSKKKLHSNSSIRRGGDDSGRENNSHGSHVDHSSSNNFSSPSYSHGKSRGSSKNHSGHSSHDSATKPEHIPQHSNTAATTTSTPVSGVMDHLSDTH